MTRHSLVSCSPTRRATALTGIAETRLMTNASNSKVKPLSGRAQGTLSVLIPQRVQCTRGTRAYRNAWCWKKSRCRQLICSVSYAGQSAAPAAGASKPAAGGEVDVDVELTRLGVELAADDRPWRYQPQRQLQQAGVAHGHFLRTRAGPLKPGAVLAAVKDAARRFAVACGHP